MKIIFFGSSRFGYPALKKLIESCYQIPLVVTQPDRLKGRGMKFGSTQIKELAEQAQLKVFQPEDINSPEAVNTLKKYQPDLFVIIAYGQKFSAEVLNIPSIVPINVHASLLPKYRGAAPINWAIINGDRLTGNTVMKVVPRMDAGPMILQNQIAITPDDDALSLDEKLSEDSAILLLKAINLIESQKFELIPQDDSLSTMAPKLSTTIAKIDWYLPALKIHNLVRGCVNWSSAFTKLNGKILKIYKTRLESKESRSSDVVPGQVLTVSPKGIIVACGNGSLSLQELHLEGKSRLTAGEFLSGNKINLGEKLG
ncbi:MAG: methionyl-tRNA formyltransferase [Candidatus Omnitrophica bacterium]|nr:methionyl-tRNA formyltransferase [Candidatus Omnitrophota bacterium]